MGIPNSAPIPEQEQKKWCKLMLEKCEEEQIILNRDYSDCVSTDFKFNIQHSDESYVKPIAYQCTHLLQRRTNMVSYCEQIKEMCKDGNLPFDKE